MKKIIYILPIICLASLSFFSCDDVLDAPNKSSFDDDVVFADSTMAEGAVMSIYYALMGDRGYRNRLMYMGVNTDIEVHSNSNKGSTATDRTAMAVYNLTPALGDGFNDSEGKNLWGITYKAIELANLCISNIRKYGNTESSPTMRFLLGEALTVRSMLYFDLVKWWGDVPARFSPTTEETIETPKSDRDIVLKQILSDLDEAANLLPWPNEVQRTKTVERPSKAFAKALRARVALFACGEGLRPENGGIIRRSNDPELTPEKMYPIALKECNDVILQKCNKLIDFETIFKNQCKDIIIAGEESVFELPFSTGRGQWLSYLGLKHNGTDKYSGGSVKGEVSVPITQFYAYAPEDLRRDVTCPVFWWGAADANSAQQECTKANKLYLGKWRAEWTVRRLSGNDDGINPCIMRYADILLMYAEADLFINGTNGDGLEYLNQVRRRAFGKPLTSSASGIDYSALTLDNIMAERALEFCGENIHKYDLMRWGILKDKMDQAISDLVALSKGEGKYASISPSILWRAKPSNTEELEFWGLNLGQKLPHDLQDSISKYNYEYKVYRSYKDGTLANTSDSEKLKYQRVQYVLGEVDAFTQSQGLGTGWLVNVWISETSGNIPLVETYSESLYVENPNLRQLLPIMNIVIAASRGVLYNDYGY